MVYTAAEQIARRWMVQTGSYTEAVGFPSGPRVLDNCYVQNPHQKIALKFST